MSFGRAPIHPVSPSSVVLMLPWMPSAAVDASITCERSRCDGCCSRWSFTCVVRNTERLVCLATPDPLLLLNYSNFQIRVKFAPQLRFRIYFHFSFSIFPISFFHHFTSNINFSLFSMFICLYQHQFAKNYQWQTVPHFIISIRLNNDKMHCHARIIELVYLAIVRPLKNGMRNDPARPISWQQSTTVGSGTRSGRADTAQSMATSSRGSGSRVWSLLKEPTGMVRRWSPKSASGKCLRIGILSVGCSLRFVSSPILFIHVYLLKYSRKILNILHANNWTTS